MLFETNALRFHLFHGFEVGRWRRPAIQSTFYSFAPIALLVLLILIFTLLFNIYFCLTGSTTAFIKSLSRFCRESGRTNLHSSASYTTRASAKSFTGLNNFHC